MRRRKVLYGIAASFPLLAGCSGGSEDTTPQQTTTTQTSTATETTEPTQTETVPNTPTGTATQSGTGSIDGPLKTYSNKTYGYSIQYPSGWTVNETDPSGVYMEASSTERFEGIMAINAGPISDGMTLDTYTQKLIQGVKGSYNSAKVIKQQSFTLKSGQPATIADMNLDSEKNGAVYAKFCFTIAGGTGYYAQFHLPRQNDPTDKQTATKIIESLTIK